MNGDPSHPMTRLPQSKTCLSQLKLCQDYNINEEEQFQQDIELAMINSENSTFVDFFN